MPDTILKSTEARLLQSLRALGDANRASQEKRYQKSRWEHWASRCRTWTSRSRIPGELSQAQALEFCRRLWREPVWDLKIVAGRILARKSIAPDARIWGFVAERSPI